MRNEQEQPALRWLLEHLQKRIGARAVEIIDGIDDGDSPTSLPGGRTKKRHRTADIVHRNLVTQHTPLVDGPFDDQKIRLRLCGDATGHWTCGIDLERDRVLHILPAGIGMAKDEARSAKSERGLANPFRPGNEDTVRHTARAIG